MYLVKQKNFYINLIKIAIPAALQDLIKFGLALVDNIMVGKLSEINLSAVTLANQATFLFMMMNYGLVCGGTVLLTQYHGKKDFNAINKITHIILAINFYFSCVFSLGVLLFPELVMKIYTRDQLVISQGVKYLKIIGWSYLLYGFSNSLVLILRSIKLVRMTLLINTCAFVLNIILDWSLIFGKLNFPRLEIQGAAFATLISRIFEIIIILFYISRLDKKLKLNLKKFFKLDKILLKDFINYAMPVFINELFWSLGISLFSVVLGHLGTEAIAAWSVTSSIEQFAFIPIYGVSSAANIIIGNEVGANKIKQANKSASTLLILSILFGFLLGIILFISKDFVINIYNLKESTRYLANKFMILSSCIIFIDAIGLVSIVGILRGGGDIKFSMCIDILPLWTVSIPLGIFCAKILHLPIILILISLRLDVLVRAILCLIRLKTNRWIINITR